MTTLTFNAKRLMLSSTGPKEITDTTVSLLFEGDLTFLSYSVINQANLSVLPTIRWDQTPSAVRVGSETLGASATTLLGTSIWTENSLTYTSDSLWIVVPGSNATIYNYWIDLAGTSSPALANLDAAKTWNPTSMNYTILSRAGEGQNLLNKGYDLADASLGNLTISQDDTYLGTIGNDVFNGGSGNDTLSGQNGNDMLYGGDGNDVIRGGLGDDAIEGGNNTDQLFGGFGNDNIKGGTGGDRIEGGDGDDVLRGNNGDDRIFGGDDVDRLFGDAGEDVLFGGDGGDRIQGGDDNDLLMGNRGDDRLAGNDGNDKLWGGSGNDQLSGDTGDDVLCGNSGNDVLRGGLGDDQIRGGNHADILEGNDGNDVLRGDRGMDRLSGGDGDDLLYGGASADVFVFLSSERESGVDRIKDWQDDKDKIDLTDFDFASFAEISALATDQNGHTKIVFDDGLDGSNHILIIEHLSLTNFDAGDVIF